MPEEGVRDKTAGETPAEKAEKALAVLSKADEEAAGQVRRYLDQIRTRNVVALGDSECFALRSADGVIRAFKVNVLLTIDNGGLVSIGVATIRSAEGYKAIADALGVTVIQPTHVVVDGVGQANPFVRRNARGAIIEVYARALAFGYTSKGVPAVSDRTAVFDIETYRMIDLLAKAKKDKLNFRLLPIGAKAPEAEKGEQWVSYPVDDQAAVWVNLAFAEMPDYYSTIINRSKKAAEFAQTFAQRNAIKHHPAVPPAAKLGKGNMEQVVAIAWRPVEGVARDFDQSQYADLVKRIEGTTEARDVIVVEGIDTPQDNEEDTAAVQEFDDEQTTERAAEAPLSAAASEIERLFTGDSEGEPIQNGEKEEYTVWDRVMAVKTADAKHFQLALAREHANEADLDPDIGDKAKLYAVAKRLNVLTERKE